MTDVLPLRKGGLKSYGGTWGESLAEFLGTFVLIAFGDGVVAMAVVGLPGSGRTIDATHSLLGAGDWLLITWGWALAVTFGIYVAGGVSGAHLNPAVTVAFAIRRNFAWSKVGPYIAAQVAGAFAGAALVFLLYHDAIDAFLTATNTSKPDSGTLGIFATFPAAYFDGNMVGPLIDQIVGTAFLLMFIVAVIDLRNTAVKANLGGLVIGFAVAAIGMSIGANAGYAINPARDFGPRLFAWIAGWGESAMPGTVDGAYTAYFWVPIIGPLIGGILGILVYDLFVGDVLHARGLTKKSGSTEVNPGDDDF